MVANQMPIGNWPAEYEHNIVHVPYDTESYLTDITGDIYIYPFQIAVTSHPDQTEDTAFKNMHGKEERETEL